MSSLSFYCWHRFEHCVPVFWATTHIHSSICENCVYDPKVCYPAKACLFFPNGQVVLCWKQAEQAMGNKAISNLPPWYLLQFLLLSPAVVFYNEVLWPGIWKTNKSFLPQDASGWCFITASQSSLRCHFSHTAWYVLMSNYIFCFIANNWFTQT